MRDVPDGFLASLSSRSLRPASRTLLLATAWFRNFSSAACSLDMLAAVAQQWVEGVADGPARRLGASCWCWCCEDELLLGVCLLKTGGRRPRKAPSPRHAIKHGLT